MKISDYSDAEVAAAALFENPPPTEACRIAIAHGLQVPEAVVDAQLREMVKSLPATAHRQVVAQCICDETLHSQAKTFDRAFDLAASSANPMLRHLYAKRSDDLLVAETFEQTADSYSLDALWDRYETAVEAREELLEAAIVRELCRRLPEPA